MIEDNVLIGSPSPRQIDDFQKAFDMLPCDKVMAKYMHEKEAYESIRDFFLGTGYHYQYLCIIPDDLVVPLESFQYLLDDLEAHKFAVLSGLCNISCYQPEVYTPQLNTIDDPITYWLNSKEDLEKAQKFEHLVKVRSAAFACTFIRRDIVDRIPFRPNLYGCGFDFRFEKDCEKEGIPIYVDVRAVCNHLARRAMSINPYSEFPFENFFLNLRPRELRFIKCQKESKVSQSTH